MGSISDREGHPEAKDGKDSGDPELLALVTGVPDDLREQMQLEPDAADFDLFAEAYRDQDDWSADYHRGFWTAALHLWPRGRGNTPLLDRRAHAVRAAMTRHDLDAAEAVERLKIPAESFRRQGGYQKVKALMAEVEPDHPAGLYSVTVSDYYLPRLWVPGRDSQPDPLAYPNLSASARAAVDRSHGETRQLQAALDQLAN